MPAITLTNNYTDGAVLEALNNKQDLDQKVNSLSNANNLTYPTTQAVNDAKLDKASLQKVSTLPASPVEGTYYYIPE